jgi:2-amino-4-hydroxy-6-hydroxymethyldihydropteridine diphosphokinase
VSASRWLLLLGSTQGSDERIHAALRELQTLGEAKLLAPIQYGPGSRDARRNYFNALVELGFDGDVDELVAALKAIETRLGRDRDSDEVAIDIDLLAREGNGVWRADAHAIEKRELEQAHAIALLRAVGIEIDSVSH